MKIASYKSSIRVIKSDNPAFHIHDGLITAPRAGFEISTQCPKQWRDVITSSIERGWLKPIANMTEKELILYGLSKK